MSPTPPAEAAAILRTNSLAIAFQDVITVILRVRYRVQRVSDVAGFRDSIKKMIGAATQEARRLGYSDATSQMALYAIVAFLDESILNSQDPAFNDWARRPLQEEMFGGAFAGEYFFRHLNDLLVQQDTHEGADALELHALCLLLGYRGKFAYNDAGEVQALIRRIQDKIARIREPLVLCRVQPPPPVMAAPPADPWIKRLLFATVGMAVLVIIAFAASYLLLTNELSSVQAELRPLMLHAPTQVLAIFARSFAL